MTRIRALCFDLFYTMADPHVHLEHLETEALGVSSEVWSKAFWDEQQANDRGLGLISSPEAIFDGACGLLPTPISPERKAAGLAVHQQRLKLAVTEIDPTIVDTLRTLKQRGYRLGLISNADVIDRMYWSESPAAPFFDDVIFSCDVGLVKPDPAIYRLSLSHLGVAPEEAAFVGDGGSDELHGAKLLGMTTVCTRFLTTHGGKEGAQIRRWADHTVTSFASLKRFFPLIDV